MSLILSYVNGLASPASQPQAAIIGIHFPTHLQSLVYLCPRVVLTERRYIQVQKMLSSPKRKEKEHLSEKIGVCGRQKNWIGLETSLLIFPPK